MLQIAYRPAQGSDENIVLAMVLALFFAFEAKADRDLWKQTRISPEEADASVTGYPE